MDRQQWLSVILVVLLAVAGGLYFVGYFDSWSDREALIAEIYATTLFDDAPDDPAMTEYVNNVSNCLAKETVILLEDAGCPVPWHRDATAQGVYYCLEKTDVISRVLMMMACTVNESYPGSVR